MTEQLKPFDEKSLEIVKEGLKNLLEIPEVENVLVVFNFGRFNPGAALNSVTLGRETPLPLSEQNNLLQQVLQAYQKLSERFTSEAVAEIRHIDGLAAQAAIVARDLLERQHPEDKSEPNS